MPRRNVSPCAPRDKEFFARGVFYLLDCCTNVIVRGVGTPDAIHRVYRVQDTGGEGGAGVTERGVYLDVGGIIFPDEVPITFENFVFWGTTSRPEALGMVSRIRQAIPKLRLRLPLEGCLRM